jgi:hypothetical protein
MPKVGPFHSVKPNASYVYHDNDKCIEGNNIERENKMYGIGGRPQCDLCARLAKSQ